MVFCLCGLKYHLKNRTSPEPILNVLRTISPLVKDKVVEEIDFSVLFSRIGS